MNVSENGIRLVKHFEGCELKAYKCPAGILTIGYGHTGAGVSPGLVIDQARADMLLQSDLAEFAEGVSKLVRVNITQGQFDALISFSYNCGLNNLRTSTLLRKLNAGDYAGAADEFLRWNRAGKQVLGGLTRRRKAERELFLTGKVAL